MSIKSNRKTSRRKTSIILNYHLKDLLIRQNEDVHFDWFPTKGVSITILREHLSVLSLKSPRQQESAVVERGALELGGWKFNPSFAIYGLSYWPPSLFLFTPKCERV